MGCELFLHSNLRGKAAVVCPSVPCSQIVLNKVAPIEGLLHPGGTCWRRETGLELRSLPLWQSRNGWDGMYVERETSVLTTGDWQSEHPNLLQLTGWMRAQLAKASRPRD